MVSTLIVTLALSVLFTDGSMAKTYKGAELRTKDSYKWGRFEVRMKSAAREGMLSSFFTYNDLNGIWNEIDIEILGRYPDDIQFNTITPGRVNHLGHHKLNFSPHQDYHTYAFEWTPQYVAWFVDGQEVLRQTEGHISTMTQPQKIMMNVWIPVYENWTGAWNDLVLPAFAHYDFVSYASYTPFSGNTGTGQQLHAPVERRVRFPGHRALGPRHAHLVGQQGRHASRQHRIQRREDDSVPDEGDGHGLRRQCSALAHVGALVRWHALGGVYRGGGQHDGNRDRETISCPACPSRPTGFCPIAQR